MEFKILVKMPNLKRENLRSFSYSRIMEKILGLYLDDQGYRPWILLLYEFGLRIHM
jgi:hypothetical protein